MPAESPLRRGGGTLIEERAATATSHLHLPATALSCAQTHLISPIKKTALLSHFQKGNQGTERDSLWSQNVARLQTPRPPYSYSLALAPKTGCLPCAKAKKQNHIFPIFHPKPSTAEGQGYNALVGWGWEWVSQGGHVLHPPSSPLNPQYTTAQNKHSKEHQKMRGPINGNRGKKLLTFSFLHIKKGGEVNSPIGEQHRVGYLKRYQVFAAGPLGCSEVAWA